MPRRAWVVLVLYAFLALLVTPVFPHFLSPNEFTRWAVAASLVEHGTFEVSGVTPLLGPSFEDLSSQNGRLFSNKVPGLALEALPGYAAARPFSGAPSREAMRPSLTAMRIVGASLPVFLLGAVFTWAAIRLGADPSRVPAVLFALLFATPLFAYGLLLYSHALAAGGLFGAWAALSVPAEPKQRARREILAGALLGLAVAAELPTAVPAAVIVAAAVIGHPVRRFLRVLLGAIPFGAAVLAYNAVCFGGPLEFPAGHEANRAFHALAESGVFGVSFPSPGAFLGLLADPSKGLLFFTPLLVLGLGALPATIPVLGRASAASVGLAPLSLLLLYSGYPNWHGGFTVGPRYLVPVIPFLIFPLVFRRGGRLEATLLGASTGVVALTTLVFPFVPPGFALPWGSFSGPLLSRGCVVPNLFHLGHGGLAAVLAPFVVVAVALALALGRGRIFPAVAGAVFWIAAGLVFSRLSPPGPRERLVRAYVADVYFGKAGALEEEIAATGTPQPRLLLRRKAEADGGPTDWPF